MIIKLKSSHRQEIVDKMEMRKEKRNRVVGGFEITENNPGDINSMRSIIDFLSIRKPLCEEIGSGQSCLHFLNSLMEIKMNKLCRCHGSRSSQPFSLEFLTAY